MYMLLAQLPLMNDFLSRRYQENANFYKDLSSL